MNADEKIKKMDLWIKLFFIMMHVMVVIALSTFVWGLQGGTISRVGV